jgi:hypothetical protein
MDPLQISLRRIRHRLVWVRAVEAGLAGAIGAAQLAAVITVIRIVLPQHVPQTSAHPALPLVLVPCGFVVGLAWRWVAGATLREAAMAADQAAGLQERLTTAAEVIERTPSRQGALDEHLLGQARAVAAAIDPRKLALARSMPRRAKIVAVAVLILVIGALVPAVGGPAVTPATAQQAAAALEQAAAKDSLAPAIRAAVEKATAALTQSGVRQAEADRVTSGILESIDRQTRARRDVAAALDATKNPELKDLLAKVEQGDLEGARRAAEKLGLRLAQPSGAGGPPPEERERVAAGLSGAAQVARQEDMPRLAAELEAAAAAVRQAQPDLAKTLQDLAAGMTESLRPPSAEDVAVVAQVRRSLDLPPPRPAATATASPPVVSSVATSTSQAVEADASAIRPEDRDVVRQYFGGQSN